MIHDFAIIGAGMAGASLAATLAPHGSVLMLEAEDIPGYHATGRSAAFWSETYGGPDIQPLTTASGPSLRRGGYLDDLGSLHIGRAVDAATVDAFLADFAGSDVALERVDPVDHVPGIGRDWTLGVLERSCAYIDVARLHADYLSTARRAGAVVQTGAALKGAVQEDGRWRIETRAGGFHAAVLINAAGAWADQVARLAGVSSIGITPYRRTMVQLRTDPPPPEGLPHVVDINGNFYFKPEPGGRIWLSPHDETACDPCDAAPEELDVAIAIDRLQHVVDWRLVPERRWAGLRSFAPDRCPVFGFDRQVPGFFWYAGQGGFGIQIAPAAAMIAGAMLLGTSPDPAVAAIDRARFAPDRFRRPR